MMLKLFFFSILLLFNCFSFGMADIAVIPVSEPQQQIEKKSEERDQPETVVQQPPVEITRPERHLYIRVLLEEIPVQEARELIFSSSEKIIIRFINPDTTVASKNSQVSLKVADQSLLLNNAKVESEGISFRSSDRVITCNGVSYFGSIMLLKQGESFYLINKVELEDYICCVLATESWPGWPLEINKVFAIACRTYAISIALRSKKQKNIYHVRNTNHHQTYKGMTMNGALRRAVQDTKGMFIVYDNKPILAMFDCCCGGVVPAHVDNFDFVKAPYLARSYACTHCKEAKLYRWTNEFDLETFHSLLSLVHPGSIPVRDIKVAKKDKAGLVKEVSIRHKSGSDVVSGKTLYSLSPKIKSYCFDVKKKGSKVIFQGRGFGHHLGLCQWGARAMVDKGWDFTGIISYYYPGTSLARLI